MNLFELAAVLTLDRSGYDRGLDDAQSKAEGFGSKLKGGLATAGKVVGATITAASTAVVAFGKSSVDAGMTFDSSMSQVAATMGTTVDQIQDLRDFAQEMGSKTAFSASQAADALNYMALAGYDADTSMSMLPNVLNLAAAGGIDLAYASDMITDSQSALGLTLDETSELVVKMAKASSKSNTSVAQLGEAILTVGGTAKTLAGGTTELSTALGILADNGVKGAEGGTALRNIILSLSAPTKDTKTYMEQLGLEVYDTNGNMRSLNDIFLDLNGIMSDMTQGEKTKVLNNLFNKVDLKSASALLANAGERFDELSGYIDSAWYSSESLSAAFKAYGLDIEAMQKRLEKVGVTTEEFTAALNASGGVAEVFAEEIWAAANELATNDEISKALGADLETLNAAFGATTGAAAAMADTQLDNLAGDITLFKSALEGAQIAVSDGLTPTLRKFVEFGADGISKLTDAFKKGGLTGAMDALGGVLSDGITMISNMLPDIVTAGASLIVALVSGIADNIDTIASAASNIIDTLVFTITETEILTKLIGAALSLVTAIASGIGNNIEPITASVVDVVIAIVEQLTNPETLTQLLSAGLQIIVGLANGLLAAIPTLLEALPTIIGNITSFFTSAIPLLIETGIQLLTSLVANLPVIISSICSAIPLIVSSICDALMNNLDLIIQAGVDLLVALVQNLPVAVIEISKAAPMIVSSLAQAFGDNIGSIIDAGKNLIMGLWEGIQSMGKQLGENIFNFFGDIVNGIKNLLGIHSPSTVFADMGKNIVNGVWNGIQSMADFLRNNVSNFFGGLVDNVKNMLGIHSPSTVFAEMGENMALGIGKGFDNEFASIRDDMNDQMDFTANAEVNVNKRGAVTGGYGMGAEITSSEKQPLTVIVQLSSGVELGRALIENINQAKRVDGLAY